MHLSATMHVILHILGTLPGIIGVSADNFFNVTEDDLSPNISYAGPWRKGQECHGCGAQLDKSQTFGNSWHDTTYGSGPGEDIGVATFNFTGRLVPLWTRHSFT